MNALGQDRSTEIRYNAFTRREALQWGGAVAVDLCAQRALPAFARDAHFPAASTPYLSQFAYSQVELAPGRMQQQFEENHRLLLNMNEDSLLLPFRIREGLPLKGQEMGGWYSTYNVAPACTFGQWISALSRFYAATGDRATRAKIDRLVRGYAATVEPTGKFYENYRFPAYMYDKMVCALTDAHTLAAQPDALNTLSRATDSVGPYLPPHAIEMRKVVNGSDYTEHALDESYTLPENLFLAYKRGAGDRYLALAKRFLADDWYFDPLSNEQNVLAGKHAHDDRVSVGARRTFGARLDVHAAAGY